MTQRVAFVSVRFFGHINVLMDLWQTRENIHLFLVGFRGDLGFDPGTKDRVTIIELNEKSPSTIASEFNAYRAAKLAPELRVRLYEYEPELIVYDFFCLEARQVALELGVPAICSIPALLGPKQISKCSDADLPREHLYWLWKHPYEVALKPVHFMGPRAYHSRPWNTPFDPKRFARFVYVTMGTVIPHYETCKAQLQGFLAALWNASVQCEDVFIYCAIPGSQKYASNNLVCVDSCDQLALLYIGKPHLMIFHGGGNTYSEGLQAQVPMVAYPFFGDQYETAERLGGPLELKKLTTLLSSTLPPTQYPRGRFRSPFWDSIEDYFVPGDLVYGHSKHREAAPLQLYLNQFCSWTKLADASKDLPPIADIYNDEPLDLAQIPDGPYKDRLRDVREARDADLHLDLPKDHRLVYYCLHIAQLTLEKWRNKIHFLLDDMSEMGPATRIELQWFLEHPHENVLFYKKGKRVPTPRIWPKKPPRTPGIAISEPVPIVAKLCALTGRIPMWSGRTKSERSILEKSKERKLPLHDLEAYRITYLCQEELEKLLEAASGCKFMVRSHQGRVVHLYFGGGLEVQLWPYVYLYFFCQGIPPNSLQVEMQNALESFMRQDRDL